MKNKDVEGKLISQNVIYSQWSTGCTLWLLVLLRCNQFAESHCHFDTGCTCHCIHNNEYSPHDTTSSMQSDLSPSEALHMHYQILHRRHNQLSKQRCHPVHQRELHPANQSANRQKLHQRSKQLPNQQSIEKLRFPPTHCREYHSLTYWANHHPCQRTTHLIYHQIHFQILHRTLHRICQAIFPPTPPLSCQQSLFLPQHGPQLQCNLGCHLARRHIRHWSCRQVFHHRFHHYLHLMCCQARHHRFHLIKQVILRPTLINNPKSSPTNNQSSS